MTGLGAAAAPLLTVAIAPLPGFTLLAFSGFLDTLRLAADEADRSRPIRCAWTVVSEGRRAVQASCGVVVQPSHDLVDPSGFDYVVVVGGLLKDEGRETAAMLAWLRRAAGADVPVVGLCTGSFALARAGLLTGRRACVSWLHHDDFGAEFPHTAVCSDRLFIEDGDRITCAGGVSVVHLASGLVERHLGPGSAAKGLRIMIEEGARLGDAPQPPPLEPRFSARAGDRRVRRALLVMERRLAEPLRMEEVALAAGTTPRHLSRLFTSELGRSPAAVLADLRLAQALHLVDDTRTGLAQVAASCGYTDASHLSRRFRTAFGCTPGERRRRSASSIGRVQGWDEAAHHG